MTLDLDRLWDPDDAERPRPGVSPKEFAAWERRNGVKLPKVLRDALARQDGGLIRYSSVSVLPLHEIKPLGIDFWEDVGYSKKRIPKQNLVFDFAAAADDEPIYFLNFNANGPRGEPTVHHLYHDPGDVQLTARTVEAFFADLIAVTPKPAVDWSETERLDPVYHRETLVVRAGRNRSVEEVVLGRLEGVLILYTRTNDESYGKVILPEPLSKAEASIEEFRPSPGKTYELHLEPRKADGIVSIDSVRMSDGTWKNDTDRGVPVYVGVESRNKDVLKAVRDAVFKPRRGGGGPGRRTRGKSG
jgi:hypothetical protein